jgi:hypothetical protein
MFCVEQGNSMGIVIRANTTLFDPLPQEREPEEMNFQQPYTDKEVRRTTPPRHDQRRDWTEMNNEKGHDSDVSNRYSSIPTSILLFKIEQLCKSPTLSSLQDVRQLIAHAHPTVKQEVYEHVLTLLDSSRFGVRNIRVASGAISTPEMAARMYILKRIFA